MRISDWSSDVCSSDLLYRQPGNSVARTDRSGSRPLICRSLRTSVACNRFSGRGMSRRTQVRFGISALVFALFLLHTARIVPLRLLDVVEAFTYDARVVLPLPHSSEKSRVGKGWV